jgi:hypothetical protein
VLPPRSAEFGRQRCGWTQTASRPPFPPKSPRWRRAIAWPAPLPLLRTGEQAGRRTQTGEPRGAIALRAAPEGEASGRGAREERPRPRLDRAAARSRLHALRSSLARRLAGHAAAVAASEVLARPAGRAERSSRAAHPWVLAAGSPPRALRRQGTGQPSRLPRCRRLSGLRRAAALAPTPAYPSARVGCAVLAVLVWPGRRDSVPQRVDSDRHLLVDLHSGEPREHVARVHDLAERLDVLGQEA